MADRTETARALGKSLPKLDNNKASIETLVPVEIRDVLGEPPLLATEDPNQYDALLTELAREVRPSDFIEWLWVKDIADLTWDIIRYRRIKASYIDGRFRSLHVQQKSPLVLQHYLDHQRCLDAAVDKLEVIERLLASVEYRRNNALQEIEGRRNALGRALRQTSDQIIEGKAPLVPSAAK
jgi:hypothetical protein